MSWMCMQTVSHWFLMDKWIWWKFSAICHDWKGLWLPPQQRRYISVLASAIILSANTLMVHFGVALSAEFIHTRFLEVLNVLFTFTLRCPLQLHTEALSFKVNEEAKCSGGGAAGPDRWFFLIVFFRVTSGKFALKNWFTMNISQPPAKHKWVLYNFCLTLSKGPYPHLPGHFGISTLMKSIRTQMWFGTKPHQTKHMN